MMIAAAFTVASLLLCSCMGQQQYSTGPMQSSPFWSEQDHMDPAAGVVRLRSMQVSEPHAAEAPTEPHESLEAAGSEDRMELVPTGDGDDARMELRPVRGLEPGKDLVRIIVIIGGAARAHRGPHAVQDPILLKGGHMRWGNLSSRGGRICCVIVSVIGAHH